MKWGRFNLRKASFAVGFLMLASPFIYRWARKEAILADLRMLRAKPDQRTPQEMQERIDDLVSAGPEALKYIIRDIQGGSSWNLRTFRYREILKRMGRPAHEALIQAAKSAKSPQGRFQCTFFMQEVFDDYSQFDVCIKSFIDPKIPSYIQEESLGDLRFQLKHRFPDAPGDILYLESNYITQSELTPEFRSWLEKNSRPKGSLPKMNFPKN